jgi:ADP-ribosylglycohydrolase
LVVLIDEKTSDRRRGALLGLAVGDALGAAVEFKAPGTFPEVNGFRAGGPHRLKPGEWTDDTSMALALGNSIVEVGCLGDDADTTGAVCGQLAGAWLGESGIPAQWRMALAGQDQIEPVLTRLVMWSGAVS